MIIFYDKRTGEIYGTVNGRVHTQDQIDKLLIRPSEVDEKFIGKFIPLIEPIFEEIEVPIKEQRVVDQQSGRVETVIIGVEKRKIGRGCEFKGKHGILFTEIDAGRDSITRYKIRLNGNGEVDDFVLIEKVDKLNQKQ